MPTDVARQTALFELPTSENRMVDVYDTARAYVAAVHAIDDADGKSALEAATRLAETWHDLAFAVDGECAMCDPGTCPQLTEQETAHVD